MHARRDERTPRTDADLAAQASRRERRAVSFLREGGDAFQTTRVEAALAWSRRHSLSVYPFVSACCGLELAASNGPRYDLDRFGTGLPRSSPRQSDLLMVVGTVTRRLAPVLTRVYEQMAEPKWVMAFGACTCTGGPYDNYAVVQGIDTIVPVDVYVPGCPPRPEAVLDGLLKLQERVKHEAVPREGRHRAPGARLPAPSGSPASRSAAPNEASLGGDPPSA